MPKPADHAAQRSQFAEATAGLIATGGFDAAGLRDVARAADQTTGALTHYFGSKAALLEAAYEVVMARLETRQAEFGDAATPARLREQLLAVLPLTDESIRDWRVWMAFSARAIVDARLQARHRAHYARLAATLAAEIGGDDATADLVIAVIDGLGIRMLLEPGAWPVTRVEATLAPLTEWLFHDERSIE